MDRAYRCAYAGAHRLQVELGARSRSAWTTAIAFVGFPTLLTVHQHRPLPQCEGHRPKENSCQPNPDRNPLQTELDAAVIPSFHCVPDLGHTTVTARILKTADRARPPGTPFASMPALAFQP